MTHSADSTTRRAGRIASSASPRLLAFWDGGSSSVDLPSGDSVAIGRGEESELRILHPSVSRSHAMLESGATLELVDLGSANGTRVDGHALEPHVPFPVTPRSLVEVGDAVLTVRGWPEPDAAPAQPQAAGALDPMADVRRLIERVARGNIPVTLTGETGVGKELLAEQLHALSPRANERFLRINCAALPEQLLESELFGHERGAFTGAVQAKAGLLESASGGTVFLDEVGELPQSIQAKLLRALECRELLRVGSLRPRPFDVRFVAATNRDLEAMVASGDFRADLFYRLCGVLVTVPPLRTRLAEIKALAELFTTQAARQLERPPPVLTDAALSKLCAYAWPGNVRELRHVIDCAVLVCDSPQIDVSHLPRKVLSQPARPRPESANLKREVSELERDRIVEALDRAGGNQTRAAKLLGMPRRTLIARIESYGLPRPRKKAT